LKICLIGEFGHKLDEGMKNTAAHYFTELDKKEHVIKLDVHDINKIHFWRSIRMFKPNIIHYIPGPTLTSFIMVKLISTLFPNAKIVMSAMNPSFNISFAKIIQITKPDRILVQSTQTGLMFEKMGIPTEILHSGVNLDQFRPIDREQKHKLREKFGIKLDEFVVLHIGPVKKNRNMDTFVNLQKAGYQVLIVASESVGIEKDVLDDLKSAGCIIYDKYIKNIEVVYALSDCYVFAAEYKRTNSGKKVSSGIEIPLTVLEAMATDMPVICTEYGGLSEIFRFDNVKRGLYFVDSESEIKTILSDLKMHDSATTTNRELVKDFSWDCIADNLISIYGDLLRE